MNSLRSLYTRHSLLFLLGVYSVSFLGVLLVLYRNIGAFGCFDDCSTIMAGWFLLKGRVLYSEIFFNHQPLLAYLSELVQLVTHPSAIYQLILYHRISLWLFSYAFGVFLVSRFRVKAVIFLLIYEASKFYVFGDRFLAESFLIYPALYVFGLLWESVSRKESVNNSDGIIATVCIWLVLFLREPAVPLAIFFYIILLFRVASWKMRFFSIGFMVVLAILLFLQFQMTDYFFNVFTTNAQFHLSKGYSFIDGLTIIFYPIAVFVYGQNSALRYFEMLLSGVFLSSLFFLLLKKRISLRAFSFLIIALLLANLRYEKPGIMFYEAFHMLTWFSLFIFSITCLLSEVKKAQQVLATFLLVILFAGCLLFLFRSGSYLFERPDTTRVFFAGYNQYYTTGELVKELSAPTQTLFLDGWNDLIYWQADRYSPYPYSWYTSIMTGFSRYTEARIVLLNKQPPDFFYGACGEWSPSKVSDAFISHYRNILYNTKPTCLYIKDSLATFLTSSQVEQMTSKGYGLAGKTGFPVGPSGKLEKSSL